MSFEFESFMIEQIGEMKTVERDRFAWVRVYISLTDPITSAHPSAEIDVPIQYEGDWTVEQVRQAAFDQALETLKTATGLFEQNGLQGLQRLDDEHEAAKATELERLLSAPPE